MRHYSLMSFLRKRRPTKAIGAEEVDRKIIALHKELFELWEQDPARRDWATRAAGSDMSRIEVYSLLAQTWGAGAWDMVRDEPEARRAGESAVIAVSLGGLADLTTEEWLDWVRQLEPHFEM